MEEEEGGKAAGCQGRSLAKNRGKDRKHNTVTYWPFWFTHGDFLAFPPSFLHGCNFRPGVVGWKRKRKGGGGNFWPQKVMELSSSASFSFRTLLLHFADIS